jgi:uncharacterized protein YllA (UPF0747 family)
MLAPQKPAMSSREVELLVAILDRVDAAKREAEKQSALLERIARALETRR